MKLTASRITLSKNAFLNNIRFLREKAPSSLFFPVIKANAYGHGLNEVVSITENFVDGFCVHSIDEAYSVNSDKPVLILGHYGFNFHPLTDFVRERDVLFTAYSEETVKFLEKVGEVSGKKIKVFIKAETGTNRLGVKKEVALALADYVYTSPYLEFAGFSTHFANIEDTTDHSFAREQMERFNDIVKSFEKGVPMRHDACSAAVMLFEDTRLEIVRPGISFYGYYPSKETVVSLNAKGCHKKSKLEPVLSWTTNPLQIKEVKAGEYIGYGLTFRANKDMKIAVLPVGYSDGYDRKLSNSGYVLIKGRRCPVVGRVCMNLFMVDVSHIENITLEDDVVLIGKSGKETITADTLASLVGTINYEILARLNPFIERKITD